MRKKYSAVVVLMITALLVVCANNAMAQPAALSTTVTAPSSSVANPADAGVRAHTNIKLLGTGRMIGTPQYYGPPFPGYFFETPASIACIYGLQVPFAGCNPNVVFLNPNGGSRAIAIVDAYDDPNAYSDLQGFSAQFGLAAINPTSFQVVYAPFGGNNPGSCLPGPAPEPPSAAAAGWDLEESLDIEWSHAMAPLATLYLVEAQSDYLTDLFCAVSVASALVSAAGGGEVSMSWGTGEFSGENSIDGIFNGRKVVYFAGAGDGPGAIYPSASPNVVSVGGTTLSTNPNSGRFLLENTWQDTGGGASAVEPRPSYQNSIAGIVGAYRGTPDVSADSNPNTGVWVLDSLVFGPGTWYIVGGTSLATPMWSGIVNSAGSFAASSRAELTKLYGGSPHGPSGFTDITVGNCGIYIGNVAAEGWDFCSGLGSPKTYSGK